MGYISGGDVKLYAVSNLDTPIATTKSSSSLVANEAGRFRFEKVPLSADAYYLLEISGGQDIDPNDDGEIIASEAIDLNGSVHALVKGDEMLSGEVRMNALSDMAYQKLKTALASMNSAAIDTALQVNANEYLYDIDGDGAVNNKDILVFDPTLHADKTKKSYKDILGLYVPHLYAGEDDKTKLASLMYLDTPNIVIKNGNLQEIPFTLSASIENMPAGVEVVWSLNAVENASMEITDEGLYELVAELKQGQTVLKTLTSTVVATTKTTIAVMDVNATQDSISYVSGEENASLSGIEIVVPKDALTQDTQLSVKQLSINTLPQTEGAAIGDVLVLEPAGLTFAKPVQVKIFYNQDVNLTDKNVSIARYSDNGVIDYIAPLSVDTTTNEVVFETEHFTAFQLQTSYFSEKKKADQTEITALETLTGLTYESSVWEKILNKEIADKSTVYDLYLEYKKNSEIVNKLNDNNNSGAYELFLSSTEAAEQTNRTLSAVAALKGVKSFLITNKYYVELASGIGMVASMNPVSYAKKYTTYVFKQAKSALKLADKISKEQQLNTFMSVRKTQSFEYILSKLKESKNTTDSIEVADGVYALNGLFAPNQYTDGVLKYQDMEPFWQTANMMYEMSENFKVYTNEEHIETLKNIILEYKKLIDNGGEYIDISWLYAKANDANSIEIGDTVSIDVSCEVDATSPYSTEFKVYIPSMNNYPDTQLSGVSVTKTSTSNYRLTFNASDTGTKSYYVQASAKLNARALSDSQRNYFSFYVGEKKVIVPPSNNVAPVANAGTNQSVQTGTRVYLSGALSSDANNDNFTHGWSMKRPDASKAVLSNTSLVAPSFIPDVAGAYIFTLTVYDGKLSSLPARVSVYATTPQQNTTPQASSQSLSLDEGTSKALTLSATDADGDILSYAIVTQPAHGTLSGTAPNLTYTPTSGYSGTDSFTFKANDGKSDSNIATVSLNIAKVIVKQITFVSESAPLDNSVIERGSSFTKSWTFKNSGNVALTDVHVTNIKTPSGVQATVSQNVSSSLAINAQTSYVLSITVPQNLAEGTYEASFKLSDAGGDLKYSNGNTAIFSYIFLVPKPNDFKADAYLSATSYQLNESALLGIVINDGNAPYVATINWGDGNTETKNIATVSNAINLTHKYASVGNYVVSTQIVDAMNKTANITKSLEVIDEIKAVTKWSVSGTNKETSTSVLDIPVVVSAQAGGYATYETSWTPQESSLDYWVAYRLPVPDGIFKMDKKIRLTLASKAGELEDHDRSLSYSLSNGKSYAYNIMSNVNDGSGFIRIKDFQGSDTKNLVASLTDSAIGVRINQRAYAIESIYGGGASGYAILSAYKYQDANFTALASSSSAVEAAASLKEIAISYKGNGTSYLILLEYDKNNDGAYSSEEKIILNTESMDVNWSVFAVSTPDTNTTSVVKKTGQTKSYDTSGNEIIDDSLKDDGYYQMGQTPRYTRASDTVTDELTGLMWQDDAATASITKPWLTGENYSICTNDTSSPACYDTSGDTATSYCSELSVSGYTDWRLPTAEELEGIVDYGKVYPAIDTNSFQNATSSDYWSSTTYEGGKSYAWFVYFGNGFVYNYLLKYDSLYVRCVRAGQ